MGFGSGFKAMKNDRKMLGLPGLVECRMQPLLLTEKHSGVFLSGTKWAPTRCQKPIDSSVEGPCLSARGARPGLQCSATPQLLTALEQRGANST